MVAKRQATRQGTRATKKAKLDPVAAKVKEVLDALSREDCELAGPETYKHGILAAFPLAAGEGAAKDERHANQETLITIVKEVLQGTEMKYQQKLVACKEELSAAQTLQSSKETTVTDSLSSLEEHQKLEQETRDALLNSQESLTQASAKLKEANCEVENFDGIQLGKSKERAEFGAALDTEFEKLQAGSFDDAKERKSAIAALNLILKKLEVDAGLSSAIAPALSKAPAERGSFDNIVVEQVRSALKARLEMLDADLNSGETLKAAKVAEQVAAQEAETGAQTTVETNNAAVIAAEEKTAELKATLKEAKASWKEQSNFVADIDVKIVYEQSHLENFQEALRALEFLQERPSTSPEAEVEMEKISAIEAPAAIIEEASVVV